MCAAGNADRGFTWSDEETTALLKFWGAHDAQNDGAGNKRNYVVYEKISDKMSSLGFNRSTSQCREKIKRMKREYTLTKQHNGVTSGPKKLMRFFEQFERILLEKQSQNQRNTIVKAKEISPSTSETDNFHSDYNTWAGSRNKRNVDCTETLNDCSFDKSDPLFEKVCDIDDGNPWTPAVVLIEGEQPSSSFQESHSAASAESAGPTVKKKKRKKIASRMAMFESMMEAFTMKFMEYQESADSRFLAQLEVLEKERQASDENIQKMWLQFEENRRREEQNHELHVFSVFKDILTCSSSNHISKET